jgi:hypothetical protein
MGSAIASYDAAVKVILTHCREAALEYFRGLRVEKGMSSGPAIRASTPSFP